MRTRRLRIVSALAASFLLATAAASAAAAAAAAQEAPRRGPLGVAQRSGTTAEFRGLHAGSDSVVWASGRGGIYSRTTDGGETWRADSIPGAAGLFLVDVHAAGADTAIVLATSFDGGLARVYRTVDGGGTWSATYENRHPKAFFDGMAFWDAQRGIAFGDPLDGRFPIIRTEDGGATWQEVPADSIPAALPGEAAFAASGRAVVVAGTAHAWIGTGGGTHARVFRTTNGGRSWSAAATPMAGGSTTGIFAVAFRDTLRGIAVGGDYSTPKEGRDNVLGTSDGGLTWTVIGSAAPTGVRYGAAWVPDAEAVVATGPSGAGVSRDGGRTWIALDTASVNTVDAVSPNAVWTAGVEGRITRWARLVE